MKHPPLSLALALAVGLAGCTFPSSQPTVSRAQVGVVQTLDLGEVTQVRLVAIDGQKTVLGLWGGGAVGGAAAYPGGGASAGELVGQAAAGIAGAVAGHAVEELATRKKGQELTIQLDNGRTIVVIQDTDEGIFRQGDRVQVNHGGWGEASVRMAVN